MYVAVKKLRAHGPGGEPTTYLAGDVLPQFLDYPHHIRRALLSQNWVELRPDLVAVVQPVRVDNTKMPVLTESENFGGPPPDALAPQEPDRLECRDCGRTFKDSRGLAVHKSQAHKASNDV